jgi:hypothetical protein
MLNMLFLSSLLFIINIFRPTNASTTTAGPPSTTQAPPPTMTIDIDTSGPTGHWYMTYGLHPEDKTVVGVWNIYSINVPSGGLVISLPGVTDIAAATTTQGMRKAAESIIPGVEPSSFTPPPLPMTFTVQPEFKTLSGPVVTYPLPLPHSSTLIATPSTSNSSISDTSSATTSLAAPSTKSEGATSALMSSTYTDNAPAATGTSKSGTSKNGKSPEKWHKRVPIAVGAVVAAAVML